MASVLAFLSTNVVSIIAIVISGIALYVASQSNQIAREANDLIREQNEMIAHGSEASIEIAAEKIVFLGSEYPVSIRVCKLDTGFQVTTVADIQVAISNAGGKAVSFVSVDTTSRIPIPSEVKVTSPDLSTRISLPDDIEPGTARRFHVTVKRIYELGTEIHVFAIFKNLSTPESFDGLEWQFSFSNGQYFNISGLTSVTIVPPLLEPLNEESGLLIGKTNYKPFDPQYFTNVEKCETE